MSSPATTPAAGRGGRYAERQPHGLVLFAAVLLVVLGFFNLIDGISAVARSHVFIANAHFVFGDLKAWGWVALILGALQLLAAAGVLAGNQAAAGSRSSWSRSMPWPRCSSSRPIRSGHC
jgi:hypothetical protein